MIHGIDTGFLVAAEVLSHPAHASARAKLQRLRANGDRFGIAPQVLAEFIHIVTDPKRFSEPLRMEAALFRAERWWLSPESAQLGTSDVVVANFFTWMRQHHLGRKRLLDTILAATFRAEGIASVLTTNPKDFVVLGGFECIIP